MRREDTPLRQAVHDEAVEPPTPSASAPPARRPPPEFDNAFPTQPGPAPVEDAGPPLQNEKPPLPGRQRRPTGLAK